MNTAVIKNGNKVLNVDPKNSIIITLSNGDDIRVNINNDNITIFAVNNVNIDIVSLRNMPGVKIYKEVD